MNDTAEWRLVKGVPDSDGDSWDIYEGEERIAFDLMQEEAEPLVKMHNTAMAKLREANDNLFKLKCGYVLEINELTKQLAKLREESKQFKDIISRSILDPADEEIVNALLAHQQPSAFVGKKPCKRCGVFFFEDEKECPHCSEPRQPSVPTADVEKGVLE